MTESGSDSSTRMRLWPGVVIVVVQWIVLFGSGVIAPGTSIQFFGMVGGPLGGVLLLLAWWLFASRAPRFERRAGVGLMVAAIVGTFLLAHRTMAIALIVYAIPVLCLVFVAWALVTRGWSATPRRVAMVVAIVTASTPWLVMRSAGVRGDMAVDMFWRWSATAEDRLLAAAEAQLPADPATGSSAVDEQQVRASAEWPGFRGARRDGVITGVTIPTDWASAPPELLWRRSVGPGWSSFAVMGERLFTQEQRGDDEIVSCYDATTGEPVWSHRDDVRFWEAMAGAGPRATPTLHDGRVYTLGATGVLNVLRAADGMAIWSRDIAADTAAETPEWGFSSSPLVIDDLVVVYSGATDGKAVVAYDLGSGEPAWLAAAGAMSYSSMHEATIAGVRQLLILTGDGATSLAPDDGAVLWQHSWPMEGGARIVQPVITDEGDVLIGTGFGLGLRRVAVTYAGGTWSTEERWTSRGLKPYFNDLVVHDGHAYGFDGRYLSCVELDGGEQQWKGGRYGHGQLTLLGDQGILLVLSEKGEIALVRADPAGYEELSRVAAIAGKTWNHPVIVDGVLYVRNGEEMAAFRVASGATARR